MKYLGCKIDYKAIKFQLNICIHYQSWSCVESPDSGQDLIALTET